MVDLSKYIQEGARLELEAMERMAEECSFCSSMSAQHSAQAMQIDELKRDLAAANARADGYRDIACRTLDKAERNGRLAADEIAAMTARIATLDAAIAAKEKP